MKVNGYQIREALKRWKERRDALVPLFEDSIYVFEGETKAKPQDVTQHLTEAWQAVCKLEEIQQHFNQKVVVEVAGEKLSLSFCIKYVHGASQVANLWRGATVKKRDRWDRSNEHQRNKDTEYARRTVTFDEVTKLADEATKLASQYRSAIAVGNAQQIEISEELVTPKVLESLLS